MTSSGWGETNIRINANPILKPLWDETQLWHACSYLYCRSVCTLWVVSWLGIVWLAPLWAAGYWSKTGPSAALSVSGGRTNLWTRRQLLQVSTVHFSFSTTKCHCIEHSHSSRWIQKRHLKGPLALDGAFESKRVHTGSLGKSEERDIKNFTQFLCHIFPTACLLWLHI
jgi:hypothetical protein